jgi:SAM-dependent methyltransferase
LPLLCQELTWKQRKHIVILLRPPLSKNCTSDSALSPEGPSVSLATYGGSVTLKNLMATPRSLERLRNHYEVEKELATRLRASTREERPALFKELYTELFDRVPDHPRLTRREAPEESQRKVAGQMRLLRPFLSSGQTLIEFAPGDCRLAYEACQMASEVIGVDISDQRSDPDKAKAPANFRLAVYDGYHLELPDRLGDVAFSYQFLEHLHPDDVGPHLQLVLRLLKPGGWYVFDTPHRYTGPNDISGAFGDALVCFHFQEWTLGSMRKQLRAAGFETVRVIKRGQPLGGLQEKLLLGTESLVGRFPPNLRKRVARRLFSSVAMAAQKQPSATQ